MTGPGHRALIAGRRFDCSGTIDRRAWKLHATPVYRLHVASGVAFLDDDDVWAPEKLRLQIDGAHLGGSRYGLRRGASMLYCWPSTIVEAPPAGPHFSQPGAALGPM